MSIQNRIYQSQIRLNEAEPPADTTVVDGGKGGGGDGPTIDDSGDFTCDQCIITQQYWADKLSAAMAHLNKLRSKLHECIDNAGIQQGLQEYLKRWCGTPGVPSGPYWNYKQCVRHRTNTYNRVKREMIAQCHSDWDDAIFHAENAVLAYANQLDQFRDPDHWCNRHNCFGTVPSDDKDPVSKDSISATDPRSVFQGGAASPSSFTLGEAVQQTQAPTHMPWLTPNEWQNFVDSPDKLKVTLNDILDDEELVKYVLMRMWAMMIAP